MERRHGILVIALIGLAAGAALWFGIGRRAARESSSADAPPPGLAAPAPGGPRLTARAGKSAKKAVEEGALGTLVVHVKSKDGAPIAGARVAVEPGDEEHVAATNSEGVARLAGLSGTIGAFATAEGFTGNYAPDTAIPAGSEASVTVELSPGVPFDGVVVDSESGRPIPGVEITVSDSGSLDGGPLPAEIVPWDLTRSGIDGRFHVRGVTDDHEVLLDMRASRYVHVGFMIEVAHGVVARPPLVLHLEPAGRLVGVVRGPDGAVLSGATIFVISTAGRRDLKELIHQHSERFYPTSFPSGSGLILTEDYEVWSGEDGAYVVDGIPSDGEYVAVAWAKDLALSVVATGIRFQRPALEAHHDFAVRAYASLVVRLVDPAGKSVAEGAKIAFDDLSDLGGTPKPGRPDDGAEDIFRFDHLPPGDGRIEVSALWYLPAAIPVHLEAGRTSEVLAHMDPGVTVQGIAVDEDGRPLPGVRVDVDPVAADPQRGSGASAESDEEGHFLVRTVAPRASDVSASGTALGGTAQFATVGGVRVEPPATGVRLVLVRLGEATLRIKKPEGKPYTGEFDAYDWPPGEGARVYGEAEDGGLVRWSGFSPGEHGVRLQVRGFVTTARTVAARLRATVDLGEVVLERGAVVKMALRTAAGKREDAQSLIPVRVGQDGKPQAYSDDGWDRIDDGETYGSTTLRLAPGRWQIFVQSDQAGPTTPKGPSLADWTVTGGETRDVEIRLPAR